jgi:hypothetical protein
MTNIRRVVISLTIGAVIIIIMAPVALYWIGLSNIDGRPVPPGSVASAHDDRAIWLIVRQYNSSHLKDRRMGMWHLSGAALTIWLTQHWTTDEAVVGAATAARLLKTSAAAT